MFGSPSSVERCAMESGWLDAEETAASLQITKATLYKLVREGRVPASKVGGKWRFQPEAIDGLFAGAGAVSGGWGDPGGSGR
jgi:excisionase family DNA binding protein